eukprot:3079145-Pleurochrysis_carterae.AAC.1
MPRGFTGNVCICRYSQGAGERRCALDDAYFRFVTFISVWASALRLICDDRHHNRSQDATAAASLSAFTSSSEGQLHFAYFKNEG